MKVTIKNKYEPSGKLLTAAIIDVLIEPYENSVEDYLAQGFTIESDVTIDPMSITRLDVWGVKKSTTFSRAIGCSYEKVFNNITPFSLTWIHPFLSGTLPEDISLCKIHKFDIDLTGGRYRIKCNDSGCMIWEGGHKTQDFSIFCDVQGSILSINLREIF
jgi:hypothetical protein